MRSLTIELNGRNVLLTRHTPEAMIALGSLAHADELSSLGKALDEIGIHDTAERIAVVRVHNQRRGTLESLVTYALTIAGAKAIIDKARPLATTPSEWDAWFDSHSPQDWLMLALDLIGARTEPSAEGKATGTENQGTS